MQKYKCTVGDEKGSLDAWPRESESLCTSFNTLLQRPRPSYLLARQRPRGSARELAGWAQGSAAFIQARWFSLFVQLLRLRAAPWPSFPGASPRRQMVRVGLERGHLPFGEGLSPNRVKKFHRGPHLPAPSSRETGKFSGWCCRRLLSGSLERTSCARIAGAGGSGRQGPHKGFLSARVNVHLSMWLSLALLRRPQLVLGPRPRCLLQINTLLLSLTSLPVCAKVAVGWDLVSLPGGP